MRLTFIIIFCSISVLSSQLVSCLSLNPASTVVKHRTAFDADAEGFWQRQSTWKSRWVKYWRPKITYVPVWKKVWGPVIQNEWMPLPNILPELNEANHSQT
uniref:Spondin domain-containing protein n=1 Tax=Glossina austeni TaxID=7395 RepID=A0A1A9UQ18_GLOAU